MKLKYVILAAVITFDVESLMSQEVIVPPIPPAVKIQILPRTDAPGVIEGDPKSTVVIVTGNIVTIYDPAVLTPIVIPPVEPPPVPVGTVVIKLGDSIQAAVINNPGETTFLIKPGIHRNQQVTPKTGNIFIGEPGAILNGSKVLTFSKEGDYFVSTDQTQQGQRVGMCLLTHPRCNYPEDLFIDNQLLEHVPSLSLVAAGKWFFDYDLNKIYLSISDDPTGNLVETSVMRNAFDGPATKVTIKNLVIEKYASPGQAGAIGDFYPTGEGWLVENCEIKFNHGVGLMSASKWIVRNNKIHHNGELGMGGGGDDVLIEGNEINHNLTVGYNPAWEGGGTKWAVTKRLIVRKNHSHHNKGNGLWTDIDNYDTLYEDNLIENNEGGISHEISFNAIIRRNIIKNNGPAVCSWLWGGAIQIQNSSGVEVYENTITLPSIGCPNGITIIQQRRVENGKTYVSINNNIHHNKVIHQGNIGASGVVQDDITPNLFAVSSKNTFNNNTYIAPEINGRRWAWNHGFRDWVSFKSYGQEALGVFQR